MAELETEKVADKVAEKTQESPEKAVLPSVDNKSDNNIVKSMYSQHGDKSADALPKLDLIDEPVSAKPAEKSSSKPELPPTAKADVPPAKPEVPPAAKADVPPAKPEVPPAAKADVPPAKPEVPPAAKADVPPAKPEVPAPAKPDVPPAKPEPRGSEQTIAKPTEKSTAKPAEDPRVRRFEGGGAEAVTSTRVDSTGRIDRVETRDGRIFERTNVTADGAPVWRVTRNGSALEQCADVRVAQNGDLSYRTMSDRARTITETRDGRFFVRGTDGVNRRYVDAGQHEARPTPPEPNPGFFVSNMVEVSNPGPEHAMGPQYRPKGGEVQNNTNRPLLVIGNGARDENGNKTTHAYILRAGQSNNGFQSDVDGFVTDPRFQPTITPSGRILMPETIPPDAKVVKISDTAHVTVTGQYNNLDWEGSYWLRSSETTLASTRLSGGQPVRPEAPRRR